jgi:hypothetical protein
MCRMILLKDTSLKLTSLQSRLSVFHLMIVSERLKQLLEYGLCCWFMYDIDLKFQSKLDNVCRTSISIRSVTLCVQFHVCWRYQLLETITHTLSALSPCVPTSPLSSVFIVERDKWKQTLRDRVKLKNPFISILIIEFRAVSPAPILI